MYIGCFASKCDQNQNDLVSDSVQRRFGLVEYEKNIASLVAAYLTGTLLGLPSKELWYH